MGYSCNAVDSRILETLVHSLQEKHGDCGGSSNSWGPDSDSPSFYEIGRENNDGSVTGTVWVSVSPGRCRKAGSFKISEGKVVRFPGADKKIKAHAEIVGAAYREQIGRSYLGAV